MNAETMESLYAHIEECRILHDFEGIFHYASQLYDISREQKDKHYQIIACYFLGNVSYNRGVYHEAMLYLQEGICIGERSPILFFKWYPTTWQEWSALPLAMKSCLWNIC